MALTYDSIASNTVGTATNTITFSSIPSTYTDLILVNTPLAATGGTSDYGIYLYFNGDSTSGLYSDTYLYGNGTSAVSTRHSPNQNRIIAQLAGYLSSTDPQTNIWHFNNYANTSVNKTVIGRSNNVSSSTEAWVGLWRNTAAINEIKLTTTVGSFKSGSVFSLYGIKAA